MKYLTKFTVLIERRALRQMLALLTAFAVAFGLLAPQRGWAAPGNGQAKKIAKDLQAALDAPSTPSAKWAKDINGTRQVQVVIMSTSTDKQMTDLRTNIGGLGGSVHVAMPGLRAVTATLPATQVAKIAARSDVLAVAPNRATSRTASTLESITGTLTTGVRTNST